jgi:radical SAM superfamily enzyme YgiQ (UPF0313 family)
MKVLLTAVNAKYIHSNLGIYSLKAYAEKKLGPETAVSIELAEYTINHQNETILQEIAKKRPDMIGFSCYIWNISCIRALLLDIKKILPGVHIWLGGPEVSYNAEQMLEEFPAVDGVMTGEGEETFAELLGWYEAGSQGSLSRILGIVYRGRGEKPGAAAASGTAFIRTAPRPLLSMDELPFSYASMDMKTLEHRIIYYESSRGCPFSCAYCLSSIDKTVRFRSLELVKKELLFFLKAGVPQVKFVDRTFNCKKSHTMEIWRFIRDNDNQITNFHFEIAADLLDEEELGLLSTMRPGLVQLEIGVQSTNMQTLDAIRRKTDIEKIRSVASRINSSQNIHQHLDLIAGLPFEGMDSFRRSFNDVFSMEPEQLQLGFLKLLKGSYMGEMADSWGIVGSSNPPYEVFSTRWLSYEDVMELKAVEQMVEIYYNSGQFTASLKRLLKEFPSPYEMFCSLAGFYEEQGFSMISHSRLARYEILWKLIEDILRDNYRQAELAAQTEQYRDLLMYDLYLRENVKSRPSFARDQSPYKEKIKEFFRREERESRYLLAYKGCDSRQMANMAHGEAMADGSLVIFDYRSRSPLTGNARTIRLEGYFAETQTERSGGSS